MVVFCYNQENYIKESIESCLKQDYDNLELIISDDASQDKTSEIIKDIIENYKGSAKIKYNKNKENLGIGRHFNFIMQNLVNSELVVMAAGDDISEKNRVSRIVDEWIKNNKPSLVAHNLIEINEHGNKIQCFRTIQYKLQRNRALTNNTYALLQYLKFHQPIPFLGAAVAYKTNTYRKFNDHITFPDYEDHLMYFRALLSDGAHYFDEKLIRYRKHDKSYMAQETKPLNELSNDVFNYYKNNKNKIEDKYKNCFQTHKITVQQWNDYKQSVREHGAQIDYEIIHSLWCNIMLRHRYLLKNISFWYRQKAKIASIVNRKKNEIPYITPLNAVLFGTSQAALNLLNNNRGAFNVIAAVNNIDPNIRGKNICGIDIINLDDLIDLKIEIDCLLIASNKYYQIKNLLLSSTDIPENKIVRIPALLLARPL